MDADANPKPKVAVWRARLATAAAAHWGPDRAAALTGEVEQLAAAIADVMAEPLMEMDAAPEANSWPDWDKCAQTGETGDGFAPR